MELSDVLQEINEGIDKVVGDMSASNTKTKRRLEEIGVAIQRRIEHSIATLSDYGE